MSRHRAKREESDFEISLNSFIKFCYKIRSPGEDKEIFDNLKRYGKCLEICHENDDIEETHVSLYSDLIEELLELEEEELLKGIWLKEKNWDISYISKKGKKQSSIAINLSKLFATCGKDKKETFLYHLYDTLQHATETRKQRLYFRRVSQMLEEEEEEETESSSEEEKPSMDKIFDEVGGAINKKTINSLMGRLMKIVQNVDMDQMKNLAEEVTAKPVTKESIQEAMTRGMDILAIPEGDEDKSDDSDEKD